MSDEKRRASKQQGHAVNEQTEADRFKLTRNIKCSRCGVTVMIIDEKCKFRVRYTIDDDKYNFINRKLVDLPYLYH